MSKIRAMNPDRKIWADNPDNIHAVMRRLAQWPEKFNDDGTIPKLPEDLRNDIRRCFPPGLEVQTLIINSFDIDYEHTLGHALKLANKIIPGVDWVIGKTNDGMTQHASHGPGLVQRLKDTSTAKAVAYIGNEEDGFAETPQWAVLVALLKVIENDKRKALKLQ